MIGIFALLLQPTVHPMPPQSMSDQIASVRYDCSIVDERGDIYLLNLVKRGRFSVIGEYNDLQKTNVDLPFIEPDYHVFESSSGRFQSITAFGKEPRRINGQNFLRATNADGEFAALVQLTSHQLSSGIDPKTGEKSGLSMIMYMPRLDRAEQTETLGGVCVATRLEDQKQ